MYIKTNFIVKCKFKKLFITEKQFLSSLLICITLLYLSISHTDETQVTASSLTRSVDLLLYYRKEMTHELNIICVSHPW